MLLGKACHDFETMKSILDEAIGEQFHNSRPFMSKKGGQKFNNLKITNNLFTFWTLPKDPGGYKRDFKGYRKVGWVKGGIFFECLKRSDSFRG